MLKNGYFASKIKQEISFLKINPTKTFIQESEVSQFLNKRNSPN
jgi:hypothetical protein